MNKFSRRQFLGTASCASVTAIPFLSTLLSLNKLNAASGANLNNTLNNDYRALVCILLEGGNDSFNMLVPRGSSEHQLYTSTRGNLALPAEQLLPIETTLQTGIDLGIHPSMPEVQQMYNAQQLAFISNIGTLIEPTTLQQFEDPLFRLPLGLFSHSDQIMQWQTSVPQDRSAIGWGGKMADLLTSMNENQNISMNISLSGNNTFQAGNQTIEFSIDSSFGPKAIEGYNGPTLIDRLRTNAINNMLGLEYQDIFKQTYANTIQVSLRANEQFAGALNNLTPLTTTFPEGNQLATDLELVARTIAVRDTLQMRRQVFFINVPGWDHHDEVINIQAELLSMVSSALGSFQTALDELNVADCVTTFTISDFGRTLTSNGNGSDHGWGGNVMVMGGAVNGGEVYGLYPELALNNALDVGGGVYIPTTSTDEYFAELALWMGVSMNDLNVVLPNIGNFYSIASQQPPIGFLNF